MSILAHPRDVKFLNNLYLKYYRIILFAALALGIFYGCEKSNESARTNQKPSVYVEETDDDFQLIRHGKPFYIKGGATSPEYLKELAEAGANTARIYDTINLAETLDQAEALGLAVVVDIPLPKFVSDPDFYEEKELFTILQENIAETVKKHKDHPALLYWNLGNELYYPYLHVRTSFFQNYNKLIDLIHEIDPNHPVSTTTIGANKSRVLTIITRSPQLDFISFNSFGILSQFEEKLKPISPVWKGPHVISEWGVNGPWEASLTSWNAPIEETSTKKAEQIKERYHNYIEPLKEINSLGSFIFYWSNKNEITPTWYSLFGEDHLKTQAVFELANIWKKTPNKVFPGPEVEYVLINNEGAFDNIILIPGEINTAEVSLPDGKIQDPEYRWEIRHESWDQFHKSKIVRGNEFEGTGSKISFKTPKKEGPYRLFVYLTNNTGYVATANVPFYVLKPEDGK